MRYGYIATFPELNKHHSKHHLDPLNHLSTVALIRTQDDHYLFGRRVRNGSVDEISVSCGADIERNLHKEFNEEVGIGRGNIMNYQESESFFHNLERFDRWPCPH